MKRIGLLLILTLSLCYQSLIAQNEFEGIITMNLETLPATSNEVANRSVVTFTVKDNMTLIEVSGSYGNHSGESARMIVDNSSNDMYILSTNSNQKESIKFNFNIYKQFNKAIATVKEGEKSKNPDNNIQYIETGKTKTIDGFKCFQVKVISDDIEGEYWYTNDYNFDFSDFMPLIDRDNIYFTGNKPGYFILEGWQKNKHTAITNRYTMNIKKQAIPDSEFEIPDGYHVSDMTQLMNKMMNANPQLKEQFMQEMEKAYK